MHKFIRLVLIIFVIILGTYLVSPVPGFPADPPHTLASVDPADTESFYRRSYYTSLSRAEIMFYYRDKFSPNLSLVLPPEDGQIVIRDQTRSSWLEELCHIGKDSLYINGFYPTKPSEQLYISGVNYAAKITVRYVPSSIAVRLTSLGLVALCFTWLFKEYGLV